MSKFLENQFTKHCYEKYKKLHLDSSQLETHFIELKPYQFIEKNKFDSKIIRTEIENLQRGVDCFKYNFRNYKRVPVTLELSDNLESI